MRRARLAVWVFVLVLTRGERGHVEEPAGAGPPPAPASVKVAGVVLKWVRGDKEANWRRLEPLVREAAGRGAKIVCTTECFLDGYAVADKSMPLERFRELGEVIPEGGAAGGSYFKKLAALAGELDIFLVAGLLEDADEARYNAAVVLGPDGALLGKYRKQSLGHEVPRNTRGRASPSFPTPFGRLGVMICADRREPALVKGLCDGGADFLLCPSGGMFGPERNDPIVQARSRETGRFIIFVHPAEFLVTGPDGSILARTILGDRLLIEPAEAGTPADESRVFYFDLPLARSAPDSAKSGAIPPAGEPAFDLEAALARRLLEDGAPLREVQQFTEARIVEFPEIESPAAWRLYAERLRRQVLERVVFRGEAARWRDETTSPEWLDTIPGGPSYRIRKLRFEAVPGVWVPALLYEPSDLAGKVPVVLDLNGHDGDGKALRYKQAICINHARRGMLALNLEWFGMGQLRAAGFEHYRMNQLDLCGTSGLAPFYLAMKRGLDILLAHEHADPERVAVTGLSGGGWQTIVIAALDERVTFANPVAGYGSFRLRARHLDDLGDSEQTPTDLASIADYTHLTALLAPRPALLTYNAADDCCFKAEHTLPPLLEAAVPVYRLFGKEALLRSHVNLDPGTHNFERDNREAHYRALGDAFFAGVEEYRREEIPCDEELKPPAELQVELPGGNGDFHALALALSRGLPLRAALPGGRAAGLEWQRERRARLAEIVRAKDYDVVAEEVERVAAPDGSALAWWRLRVGGEWTLPAVELAPPEPTHTVVVTADGGRAGARALVEEALGEGARVVALDPFYFGESAISQKDFLFALLVASVGDRPLGIQASQLAAVCRWLRGRNPGEDVRLRARGPRASLFALVAAALAPDAVSGAALEGSYGSLKEVIEGDLAVNQAPELFCFGLLEQFDVLQVAALVAPRPLQLRSPSVRAREELAALAAWWRMLGSEFDPLRD